MRRAAVVVALLVVLSGCNAFGGGDGERRTDGRTVSAAPVPTTPDPTATATPGRCLAPRPATPTERTLPTPIEPVSLPTENGTVDGSALVERHAEALAAHRFRLRVGDATRVRSMPGAVAFAFEGVGLGVGSVEGYAVGGTLYTVELRDGRLRVIERPYRPGSAVNERYVDLLTGRDWLADRLGWLNYEVVGERRWNGTTVRVLRDTLDLRVVLGSDARRPGSVAVNSTLYVDRRGIVRRVHHVRHLQYATRTNDVENVTDRDTLTVDQLGSARIHRPDSFCVAESEDAVLATPWSPPSGDGDRVSPFGPPSDSPTGTDVRTPNGSTDAGSRTVSGTTDATRTP